ncbi:MAG: phosphoenolpyruvate carboxylase [Flavobacteriaceae bacterium]
MARKPKLERFNERVLSKFQLYNNLFLSLPFENIKDTGVFVSLFADYCQKQFETDADPKTIVESFFAQHLPDLSAEEQVNTLFRFIQYIERQVVLFDAIEDAAYPYVNNMHGRGTLRHLKESSNNEGRKNALVNYLNQFKVRIVLTAHPTQFYPDSVLGIINDLSKSLQNDDLDEIKTLLSQLGKTPFYQKKKPTPFDEAVSLIWFLENVFYHSASSIVNYIDQNILPKDSFENSIFDFGFWPGGDRDGNPFVTPEITLQTAERLRFSVVRNYYRDLRKLKRKLTFDGIDQTLESLTSKVFEALFNPDSHPDFTLSYFQNELEEIHAAVIRSGGLYAKDVKDLINKVKLFGFHFASLDIRQDSRVHNDLFLEILQHPDLSKYAQNVPDDYSALSLEERYDVLLALEGDVPPELFETPITQQTLGSIRAMQSIQKRNGERGCNRYIISNCQSLENLLQLFALHRLSGWKKPTVDFIPLFETITDLQEAPGIMRALYSNSTYSSHLEARGNKQTIMLGFSDGTKDGGYFMANWSIYKAKEELSEVAQEFGIQLAFFDGRGGPPARGGGNTHQFYASLGPKIQADDIQLTIQGQTISSNFGTLESSQFNLEQLLSAGVINKVLQPEAHQFSTTDREVMQELADLSYQAYQEFKAHPSFIPYLERMSTLPYYAKTNIGSRPSKRGKSSELVFSDLRAIPFVGSWSLLKQNVPGFFGVGTAIHAIKKANRLAEVQQLFENSQFFRTLVFNSMMSLTKSFFKLTSYMSKDEEFGPFWELIFEEYKLTKSMLLEVSNFEELMEHEEAGKASIHVRDSIVQPLLTIQQYALMQVQQMKKEGSNASVEVYEKIITRALFGNINASRNSA